VKSYLSFYQLIISSTKLWEGKSVCKFFVELSIRKANISCPFEKHELQDNNCNITKN